MFCTNCGAQLEDNSIFCIQCGAKVSGETSAPVPVVEEPVVMEASAPVAEEVPVVEQTPVVEESFSNHIQQPYGGQPYAQTQNMPYTPVYQTKKKNSKALIPAILFAILSIAASVMVCLYGFKSKELGMGLENIAFALTAIFVIVYAVSKSNVTSIMKSVGFIAVAALHTIYYGIAAGKAAVTLLKNYFGGNSNANLTDCYYGIALILGLLTLAIYLIMNIIKGFMNSKKASMGMLVSGYFAMLLIIVCFVVDYASDKRGLFAFKFIPVDLGLIALILADIFATIARVKKFED